MFKADQEKLLQGRVKGLKDVIEVKFQVDQEAKDGKRTSTPEKEPWVCPITNKVLGASVKSVYLVPCGHAFSELAIKEVTETNCLQVIYDDGTSAAYTNQALVRRIILIGERDQHTTYHTC